MTNEEYEFCENGLRRMICNGLDHPWVCWTPIWRKLETCMANQSVRESFIREIWGCFPKGREEKYVKSLYGEENISEDFKREMKKNEFRSI